MKVLVKGLEFQSYQGITEAEREVGHRFRMDLVAEVPDVLGRPDDVGETVDYALLAKRAVELCLKRPDHTVESACERIGAGLLESFPLIQTLTLTLVKLYPALPLAIQEVGVEKQFDRSL